LRGALNDWIAELFRDPDLTRMGHAQRIEDLNLGLGWIYYGLARVLRPAAVVVIGSYRGFVPLVLGKALADNGGNGWVHFIDPSHVDDFWKDASAVSAHFARYGLRNIRHYLMTTQQFVGSAAYRELVPPGIVFIDGYHSEEQVRFDYESFRDRLAGNGVILFHDSAREGPSRMYGPDRVYTRRVKTVVDALKTDPALQVLDLPFGAGVTLVRRALPPA
jgi:predicted O-methyltransferase YrrM